MPQNFDQALQAAQLRAKTLTTESIIDGLIDERNEARRLAERHRDSRREAALKLGFALPDSEWALPWEEK